MRRSSVVVLGHIVLTDLVLNVDLLVLEMVTLRLGRLLLNHQVEGVECVLHFGQRRRLLLTLPVVALTEVHVVLLASHELRIVSHAVGVHLLHLLVLSSACNEQLNVLKLVLQAPKDYFVFLHQIIQILYLLDELLFHLNLLLQAEFGVLVLDGDCQRLVLLDALRRLVQRLDQLLGLLQVALRVLGHLALRERLSDDMLIRHVLEHRWILISNAWAHT